MSFSNDYKNYNPPPAYEYSSPKCDAPPPTYSDSHNRQYDYGDNGALLPSAPVMTNDPSFDKTPERAKLYRTIHNYHEDSSELTAQDKIRANQLKSNIAAVLKRYFGKGEEKSKNIVAWLPSNSITNLENIKDSLVSICLNAEAKDALYESLHFSGRQPSKTAVERLKIRAAILYSLSWANESTPASQCTDQLKKMSNLHRKSYVYFKDKHTTKPEMQEFQNHLLIEQLTKMEKEDYSPVLTDPLANRDMIEEADMYLWMIKNIKNMI